MSRTEQGALDRHIWRKAARPNPVLDGDYVYQVESSFELQGDGTTRSVVTYTRRWNDAVDVPVDPPPKLDPTQTFEPVDDGRVHVEIKLASFPSWDVPLALPRNVFTAQEEEAGAAERAAGFEARRARFEALAPPVRELVEDLGGELTTSSWRSGILSAWVRPGDVDALVASPLVAAVSRADGDQRLLSIWRLGDAGASTRYNTQPLLDALYDGNDTSIGIAEPGMLDDEACFLFDGPNCGAGATRLLSRYQCDNPSGSGAYCDPVTSLADGTGDPYAEGHATVVASSAMADYTDDQANGVKCGDATPTHDSTWKGRATSLVPEVNLRFAGGWEKMTGVPNGPARLAASVEAIDLLAGSDVVAINLSWYDPGGGLCHPGASGSVDEAVENAFDDGKLVVIAAGDDPNFDRDPFGSCDVVGQAALPKAFAVNALLARHTYTTIPQCDSNYAECPVDVIASAVGGASVTTPDNVAHSGALSLISLAAANRATFLTDVDCAGTEGGKGKVYSSYASTPGCSVAQFPGSSFSAPVVAGAAAAVHEWAVSYFGSTVANGVGALHTLMLGMGDSHYVTSATSPPDPVGLAPYQRTTRADPNLGMGHFKAKMPSYARLSTVSLTDSANQYTTAFRAFPVATTHDFFKCVALQHEDMSSKVKVSDVQLTVQLRSPVGSPSYCSSSGTLLAQWTDTGYDVKSMVAVRSSAIGGACPFVTLYANDVEGASVTTSLYCYSSSEDDDEPN